MMPTGWWCGQMERSWSSETALRKPAVHNHQHRPVFHVPRITGISLGAGNRQGIFLKHCSVHRQNQPQDKTGQWLLLDAFCMLSALCRLLGAISPAQPQQFR